jgi:uncharacterized membrane protein
MIAWRKVVGARAGCLQKGEKVENQPPATAPPVMPTGGAPSSNDRLLAALGYPIWIVALIALLMEGPKDRPFTRYHAVQALGFNVAAFIFYFAVGILSFCVTQVLWILGCLMWMLIFVPFLAALYYAYLAYSKAQYFEIPLVTDLMQQQGWLQKPGGPGNPPASPPENQF